MRFLWNNLHIVGLKREIAITPGQLEIIAYELRISTSEILAITNADICLFQDNRFSGRPLRNLL